ncbi:glycosyltransferase [Phormidesmis priestleyi ULC007]|uniref:Glycosyltransferase n=1 Tax=Phormidesmis priestleyi ULC007 TaxID=1920490 RepID=A0A2T1D1D2_9CYAN|nr:WecB/TagA/CpsF family glycosyltransferase [Phormidesmis priestleyi]PSB14308.1 glycosyltransferase [Phormidesmis priestleyi ULC007]
MIFNDIPPFKNVIGLPVTAFTFDDQISLILKWAKCLVSRVVCIANVHMLVEAYRDPEFAPVLQNADLVTPDGMPLVWMLRLMGAPNQDRVAGLDVLLALCERASTENISIFFLGSQSSILEKMRSQLEQDFPNLQISGMEPLPFRPLSENEDKAVVQKLNESGCGLVFVSLGCPKQEIWMSKHKDQVQAVMIGLGGAFPVYAGIHKRAPQVIRSLGLEWLYRLVQEPRRLWSRYSSTIPIFIWLACKQLVTSDRTTIT